MNIAMLTFGTRGDVQPFVALGRALRERGHRVRVCTSERFRGFIESHDLDYGYQSDAMLDFIESDRIKAMMEQGKSGPIPWIRAAFEMLPQVKGLHRDMLGENWEAARDADLVIHHPKGLGGPHIAEALGVPSVVVPPYPGHAPTREFPLFVFPRLPLGGLYNLATYKLAQVGSSAVLNIVNEFRRHTLGLPKLGILNNDWLAWRRRRTPVVHPISRHVLPRPHDWPDHAIVSGYWFLDGLAGWAAPDALREFLAAGPPPVYIGFGSMSGNDPERRTRVVVDAVRRAGVRAVFAAGWGGLGAPEATADDIFSIDQAPHDWLLPRCAGAVHHGGAGTLGASLRAGLPTLVCPFFVDQPFWAERVRQLGVGPTPIPQKKLAAEPLAAALSELVTNRQMRDRAAELGRKIRAEDGLGTAIDFLKKFAADGI